MMREISYQLSALIGQPFMISADNGSILILE
jgi:hypothetical protein